MTRSIARLFTPPLVMIGVIAYGPNMSQAGDPPHAAHSSHPPASRLQAAGPLPKARTGRALFPSSTVVVLTGLINARNQPTQFKFQYGLRRPYAHTTEVGERIVGGHRTNEVSETVSHLKPGSTYHYRLLAFNKYGFAVGADRTFKTLKGDGRTGH